MLIYKNKLKINKMRIYFKGHELEVENDQQSFSDLLSAIC